jgi:hypothetical protein
MEYIGYNTDDYQYDTHLRKYSDYRFVTNIILYNIRLYKYKCAITGINLFYSGDII